MPALHRAIHRLAKFFDEKGQHDKPIDVRSSRPYVRREFKAKTRGGPLFVGEHELKITPRRSE
jgi:hypothetical protein